MRGLYRCEGFALCELIKLQSMLTPGVTTVLLSFSFASTCTRVHSCTGARFSFLLPSGSKTIVETLMTSWVNSRCVPRWGSYPPYPLIEDMFLKSVVSYVLRSRLSIWLIVALFFYENCIIESEYGWRNENINYTFWKLIFYVTYRWIILL